MASVPVAHAPELEAEDPELLALPVAVPWAKAATFCAMAFTAACAVVLALTVRADLAFFVSEARPVAVGSVLDGAAGELPVHRMLTLEGQPMASNAVFYERAMFGGQYVAFALAGQRDVWVQVPIRGARDAAFARSSFTGRLVPVGELGLRFSAVSDYLRTNLGQRVGPDTLVLLADEAPRDAWTSLALVLFALGVVAMDAYLIVRWFRPLPIR